MITPVMASWPRMNRHEFPKQHVGQLQRRSMQPLAAAHSGQTLASVRLH